MVVHHCAFYIVCLSLFNHHDCKDETICTKVEICCDGVCTTATILKNIEKTNSPQKQKVEKEDLPLAIEMQEFALNIFIAKNKVQQQSNIYNCIYKKGNYANKDKPPCA